LRPIPKPKNDQEYYNDLPGKVPPDLVNLKIEKSPKGERKRERLSSNLIDLDTPPIDHNYVNEKSVFEACGDFDDSSSEFEMRHPRCLSLDFFKLSTNFISPSLFPDSHDSLNNEKWFHGIISRVYAESLLKNDGDFLVRESQNTRGQFVLTGMNFSQPKHLLLIDPEGRVRTKDRVFNSIQHLINYHWEKCLPIISAETSLILQKPIPRSK
jgi:SHC-transforming protein 1